MRKLRMTFALTLVGAVSLLYAGIASAYCGPGFSNKTQAVAFYQSAAGQKFVAPLKAALVHDGLMHNDQDLLAFLQSDKVANVVTPAGYKLAYNTSCKTDGSFKQYYGLYVHSRKNVLAVVVGKKVTKINGGKPKVIKTQTTVVRKAQTQVKQADGSVKVFETTTYKETITLEKSTTECDLMRPFEKGYCRNYVRGKLFKKCHSANVTFTQSKTYTKTVLLKTIPAPTAKNCPDHTATNYGKPLPCTYAPPTTGNCNNVTIIISGSGNTVNVCSVQITITCAGVQLVVSGPNSDTVNKAISDYQNTHNCDTTPPPSGCTSNCSPPPSKTVPVIESITALNDARIGDTSPTWCVTVKLDGSDSGTIKFAPVFGRFSVMSQYGGTLNSDGSIMFNVTGGESTKCASYSPPTEVPPGGQDDIIVTLSTGLGTVAGTPSTAPLSPWFRIDPKPVSPPN